MTRPQELWRLLNLPCEGMSRLASESLDRELSRLESLALRSHLLYCAGCRRYARQIAFLREAMRRLRSHLETGRPLPGPGLPGEIRERIEHALRER
jgi:hypothetical protein